MRALVLEHRKYLPTSPGLAHRLVSDIGYHELAAPWHSRHLLDVTVLAQLTPCHPQQCRCALERKSCIEQESCSPSRSTRLAARRNTVQRPRQQWGHELRHDR